MRAQEGCSEIEENVHHEYGVDGEVKVVEHTYFCYGGGGVEVLVVAGRDVNGGDFAAEGHLERDAEDAIEEQEEGQYVPC